MSATPPPAKLLWKLQWFVIVIGLLYGAYQVTNRCHWRAPDTLPLSWLDRHVPRIDWTVWPYLLLAGMIFLPLTLRNAEVFRRYLAAMVFGYSVNLLIFVAWPTRLTREGVPDGWHRGAFAWLYAVDSPANCFPSGHITGPMIAIHAMASGYPRLRGVFWLTFALLCPTVLTTRQHYAADIWGGLATGALGIWLSGLWMKRRHGATPEIPTPGGARAKFGNGLTNLFRFQRDPLRFMEEVTARCGPVAKCRIAWFPMIIVGDPALAHVILKLPDRIADKNTRSVARLSRIAGHSVLTANGESWFRLRKLVQPAFHHRRIARYAREIEILTEALINDWKAAPDRRLEVRVAMRQLTFRFICRVLLSADPSAETAALERSIDCLLASVWGSIRSALDLRWWLPTKSRRRFDRALADVKRFIHERISLRRSAGGEGSDLLSMLLNVRDADTGEGMTDGEIINECITLLIAGFDTTANALTWALTLLAQHPGPAAALSAEARDAANGPSPLARAVFMETLRLYPPIWIIERNVKEPVEAAGWQLAAGSQILISPWLLHRSPLHWGAPDKFDPARFLDPDVAYDAFIPFGEGPRVCIGRGIAMMEGQIVLTALAKAGSVALCGPVPVPDPGIALRPCGDVWMTLT